MDLAVDQVEIFLEAPVERHLEILLLLSAAVECVLEVCCLLVVLRVVGVLLLLSHWNLLLLRLGMDAYLDRNDHLLLSQCCRLDH